MANLEPTVLPSLVCPDSGGFVPETSDIDYRNSFEEVKIDQEAASAVHPR